MKRLWTNIKIMFHYFFYGLRSADKQITSGEKDTSDGVSVEQQKETNNVYQNLLKGELTEEVKELRHEMYYADRKSYDFVYNGGGRAKMKSLFDDKPDVEESDGNEVELVQENDSIPRSLHDYGIYSNGEKVSFEDGTKYDPDALHESEKRVKITYEFLPKFKLENYVNKVVVKSAQEGKKIVDLYVTKYGNRIDRLSMFFKKEVDSIYNGDYRSDILFIQSLSFVTHNAYGAQENIEYKYVDFKFVNALEYDGNYVFRFIATAEIDGNDILDDVYHEETEKKSQNHEKREGVELDFADAIAIANKKDNYDEAEKLINELENGEGDGNGTD